VGEIRSMTLAALFSFGLVTGVALSGSFFVGSRYCSLGDIVYTEPLSCSLRPNTTLSPWNGSQLELRCRSKIRNDAERGSFVCEEFEDGGEGAWNGWVV
jgi:hypothetical protein